jgi:hypothetical protein
VADPDLEARVRQLITELENWEPARPYSELSEAAKEGGRRAVDASRDHWLQCGMDEAYDNVIERLYWVLGEER